MILTAKAPAKINLSLDIVGTRDDGYHLIESVMQSISLCDTVSICPAANGLTVTCNQEDIPCDENNTVFKAAAAFFTEIGLSFPLSIHIEKHIPSQAGLGGASADAAAVIRLLNRLTEADLDDKLLSKIGLSVGADVPFCLSGGTALCTGIGEIVAPIKRAADFSLLIVKPNFGFDTASMYKKYDNGVFSPKNNHAAVIQALREGDIHGLAEHIGNVFEDIADDARLLAVRNALLDAGALGVCMSGSGSSVYGIFEQTPPALCLPDCTVYSAKTEASEV